MTVHVESKHMLLAHRQAAFLNVHQLHRLWIGDLALWQMPYTQQHGVRITGCGGCVTFWRVPFPG